MDDEIGRRGIETGCRSAVTPSLYAVTGGAGLGVHTVAYGERFRVGRKRVPVARCRRFPELRGKDDTGSDQEHDHAGGHDGQTAARVPASEGNADGEEHKPQHGELYAEEQASGVLRREDRGAADTSA